MRRLLLVLLVCGCERSVAPPPCPGDLQARLALRGTLTEGRECADRAGVDAAAALVVPAAVSYTSADGAVLCPERALAPPLQGTRAGDQLDLAGAARPATLTGCGCALQVSERITGTLRRDAGGDAIGFSGELVDVIAPADGSGTCAPAPGESCPATCTLRFSLDAP